jgi:inhibitor of KinA sporulation pathway (predicted exonuclease)
MQISNAYYLIVDVEATCSDDGAVPRHEMEIIEIGAVIVASKTFEIESEFQALVRPVRHPELTDFCVELTGITQDNVSSAPPFPTAINAMNRWMCQFNDSLFCSWGDYDRNQFLQDCAHHKIDYPFGPEHLNLKAEFSRCFGLKKKLGVTQALKHFGLNFEGSHHRGLDDAKNIARIVRRTVMGASDHS